MVGAIAGRRPPQPGRSGGSREACRGRPVDPGPAAGVRRARRPGRRPARGLPRGGAAWLVDRPPTGAVLAAPLPADDIARGVGEPPGCGSRGTCCHGRLLRRGAGRRSAARRRRRGCWSSANGSATRTEKAPGHLDERADCLRRGDRRRAGIGRPRTASWRSTASLARRAVVPDVPASPGPRGPALASGDRSAAVDYDDDPFGVQYWVVRWTVRVLIDELGGTAPADRARRRAHRRALRRPAAALVAGQHGQHRRRRRQRRVRQERVDQQPRPTSAVFDALRGQADAVIVGAGTARTEGYRADLGAARRGRRARARSRTAARTPPRARSCWRPAPPRRAWRPRADPRARTRCSWPATTRSTWPRSRPRWSARGLRHLLGEGGPHLLARPARRRRRRRALRLGRPGLIGGEHPRITVGPDVECRLGSGCCSSRTARSWPGGSPVTERPSDWLARRGAVRDLPAVVRRLRRRRHR